MLPEGVFLNVESADRWLTIDVALGPEIILPVNLHLFSGDLAVASQAVSARVANARYELDVDVPGDLRLTAILSPGNASAGPPLASVEISPHRSCQAGAGPRNSGSPLQ